MKRYFAIYILLLLSIFQLPSQAQQPKDVSSGNLSNVWIPDIGNGKYKNPVIFADYSDPDVCRVGDDYYLVASSFDAVPGLPVLHSKDLVNWTIIGHALLRQPPYGHFSKTQHGNGVWAPAIRYHNDSFYIYYPDPDFGIYLVKAKEAAGPWTTPVLVKSGKGIIDPCPFWDDNGDAYMVHAFAGSRAGIKSIIVINRMNAEGTKFLDQGVIVYDGHEKDPTVEGPKLYKRNGYYYIFAPAGGVSTGWQLALRAKSIYGPYERKIVMAQGNTSINGPHQGAWVETPGGKQSWFIHFRDMEAYGRVTYLEPMEWVNDWPVIGVDKDGDGTGEPVETYRKPDVGKKVVVETPQTSDEFNSSGLGLQWQWQANPEATWFFMNGNGSLRLYAQPLQKGMKNLWEVPAILMQKFPAGQFTATVKLTFKALQDGDRAGFTVMGSDYASLSLTKKGEGLNLDFITCMKADKATKENVQAIGKLPDGAVYFRVKVLTGAVCKFSYSTDGHNFTDAGSLFIAAPGRWIGAKLGLFCTSIAKINDSGYADFDWFRIESPKE